MTVAVTGIGLWTPLGANRETSWQTLLSGHRPEGSSCVASALPLAAAAHEYSDGLTLPEQLALATTGEALADAGWTDAAAFQEHRWGCVIGTSKGPLELYRPDSSHPFPTLWPSAPLQRILQEYPLTGPALCPVSACATGLDAVLRGAQLIEQGECDLVLAGSVDASINDFVRYSYRRLGVLARDDRPAEQACRPFDRDRSGFVIGAGGAMFVLARKEAPWQPAGSAYGYLERGLQYNDPSGMTQLDPQAGVLTRLLGDLLIRSGRRTSEIDVLNLHGTGTTANDLSEATAIGRVFGKPDQQPWSTASKGAHGHPLGAAGSMELAWLLLALRDQILPPVWNLSELDSACPIRPVLKQPLQAKINCGLKISLGFGGHHSAALITRGERTGN